jgi:hypothetical protein
LFNNGKTVKQLIIELLQHRNLRIPVSSEYCIGINQFLTESDRSNPKQVHRVPSRKKLFLSEKFTVCIEKYKTEVIPIRTVD